MGFVMKNDFEAWLREQSTCANCETYYGHSKCGSPKSDELVAAMSEASGVPITTFTVDPNGSAQWCPLWEANFEWKRGMRRSFDMQLEEQHSGRVHHAAVSCTKGYELEA